MRNQKPKLSRCKRWRAYCDKHSGFIWPTIAPGTGPVSPGRQLRPGSEAETVGTIVTYRPRGPSANAYKNSAISTLVTIQKTQSGWYLVGVERATVYPRNPERFTVHAKDKAVLATAHRLMKDISTTAFEIVPPTPPAQ